MVFFILFLVRSKNKDVKQLHRLCMALLLPPYTWLQEGDEPVLPTIFANGLTRCLAVISLSNKPALKWNRKPQVFVALGVFVCSVRTTILAFAYGNYSICSLELQDTL